MREEMGVREERSKKRVLVKIIFIIFLHFTILCADINECSSNNGGCAHTCTNSAGSFQCSCRTGHTLAGNGRSCSGKQILLSGTHPG